MNTREGIRRLAIFVGVIVFVCGTIGAYSDLNLVLNQRAQSEQRSCQQPFVVEGGIQHVSVPSTFLLATNNPLELRVRCQGALLFSKQLARNGDADPNSYPIPESDHELQVRWSNSGNALVDIVPLRLGEVALHITGVCPDHAVIHDDIMMEVNESVGRPKRIFVSSTGAAQKDRAAVRLSMKGSDGTDKQGLETFADYPEIEKPLLINSRYVNYEVKTFDGLPVIDLDPATGIVKPLRMGTALVETLFMGQKDLTCVSVSAGPYDQYDVIHDPCRQLEKGAGKRVKGR